MNDKKYPAYRQLTFRIHALRQMFQRRISDSDIRELLGLGTMIEDYPDDVPYPQLSYLGNGKQSPASRGNGIQ